MVRGEDVVDQRNRVETVDVGIGVIEDRFDLCGDFVRVEPRGAAGVDEGALAMAAVVDAQPLEDPSTRRSLSNEVPERAVERGVGGTGGRDGALLCRVTFCRPRFL